MTDSKSNEIGSDLTRNIKVLSKKDSLEDQVSTR